MGVGGFDPLYIGRISSAVVERVFFAPAPTTLVQIMSNTSMFLYYLFYAPTEKLARVHVGDCRHCNHGKGPLGRPGTGSRSAWSGPFATCKEAVAQIEKSQSKKLENVQPLQSAGWGFALSPD